MKRDQRYRLQFDSYTRGKIRCVIAGVTKREADELAQQIGRAREIATTYIRIESRQPVIYIVLAESIRMQPARVKVAARNLASRLLEIGSPLYIAAEAAAQQRELSLDEWAKGW